MKTRNEVREMLIIKESLFKSKDNFRMDKE